MNEMNLLEDERFLTEQVITYIGNKRKLIPYIEAAVVDILRDDGKKTVVCADLFSGSGVVARMLKKYSSKIIVNDLEEYSKVLNDCYLTNKEDFDEDSYMVYREKIDAETENPVPGIIASEYAPKNDHDIQMGERVFFTSRNASYIDTVRSAIDEYVPENMKKYYLGPLLYEASVHANTSGIFKGFYKDKNTGLGKFGGTDGNCLSRITDQISIKKPVLSNFSCEAEIHKEDANTLAKRLKDIDIAYLDPPYNQHPYGSNYFMLNTILQHKISKDISNVSGIPKDWNRSLYNKKGEAQEALHSLIFDIDAKYIILSYNNEGFIARENIEQMLHDFGPVKTISIKYNTFRGSRNLDQRNLYVSEYLFVLKKK